MEGFFVLEIGVSVENAVLEIAVSVENAVLEIAVSVENAVLEIVVSDVGVENCAYALNDDQLFQDDSLSGLSLDHPYQVSL